MKQLRIKRHVRSLPVTPKELAQLEKGQQPFATILGCSDSRVPIELVFDQGLGELFVVRLAGNVVDPDVQGSLEYAVDHLGTRLIVVMGHQNCGAVTAAMGGFTLTEDEFQSSRGWFRGLSRPGKKWVRTFERDAERRNFGGWLNPQALAIVRAAGVHEIASHGFTHVPLDEASISLEEFNYELKGVRLCRP